MMTELQDNRPMIERHQRAARLRGCDRIAVEMARRKLQFHSNEAWNEINLWGLFSYTCIRHHLEDGKLLNKHGYKPYNKTYWVTPSKEFWEEEIKPIVEEYTVEELTETYAWVVPYQRPKVVKRSYIGDCVNNPFRNKGGVYTASDLSTVINRSIDITKKTLLKNCDMDGEEFAEVREQMKQFPNDYTYHKSSFNCKPVYFYTWSCIEHFFM